MAGMEVAKTILDQMGGVGRLAMMVGAKQFVALPNGVQFKIGGGAKNKITKVRIELDPSDTYNVSFWKGEKVTTLKQVGETHTNVYCDSLMDLFERETGFYLTFKPRK